MVCIGMKPQGAEEDYVKLKAFPFTLKEVIEDWLFSMPFGSIRNWNE
jgi:hypothetical protein